MISFRISEQEYRNLMDLCASQGVRSLSDLARDAIQRLLDAPAQNGNGHRHAESSGPDLLQLHGRMMKLEGEVQRLARLMEPQAR